jgi:hypothetical protein
MTFYDRESKPSDVLRRILLLAHIAIKVDAGNGKVLCMQEDLVISKVNYENEHAA